MLKVDTACMAARADQLNEIASQLDAIYSRIADANRELRHSSAISSTVCHRLNEYGQAISSLNNKSIALSGALVIAAGQYLRTENNAKVFSGAEAEETANSAANETETKNWFDSASDDFDSVLNVLGLDYSADLSKIFGSASLAAYVAQWKTEHSEHNFVKLEGSLKNSGALFNDIKEVSDIKKAGNQWLEDNGLRQDEKITKFYDENGNEISEKDAGFYDRDYTIAEIDATASASASIYDSKFDVGENGEINVVVGNAEAHAEMSAGLYVIGSNGERQFMPGVNAEVGASVTAFEADWEQQWLGDENLGLNTEVGVTAGEVSGKGEVNAQLFSEDGKLDVQLNAEAKLEAIAVEAEGSVGVNVLGGEVEASAGINVGIGAHAEVGYKDGKFKFDVGASLGVGVSVDVEIDVGGMVDTAVDGAQVAWEGIKDGWSKLWD